MTEGLGGPGRSGRFWTRAFTLLCIFYFITFAAGYQLFPVVPLHLRAMGAGLAESGRFMAAFTLGSALGALFTGPLGDRLGARRVLRTASLVSVAFYAAYAFMPFRWGFYVLAPLHGFVWSGLRTAAVAKAGAMLDPEVRAEGMSIFGMSSPAGVALGPVLGLAFHALWGWPRLLLGLGIAFLLLHLLSAQLPPEPPEHRRPGAGFQLPERSILLPATILFLIGISFGPMPPYGAQEAILLKGAWQGALLSSLGLGIVGLRMILGIRGLGRDPIRLLPAMLVVCLVSHLALALLPGSTFRHVLAGCVYGAGYGMAHTLLFMHIIDIAAVDRRGAGVGALYASYDAGQAAGAWALGWCIQQLGHWISPGLGYRMGWALGGIAPLLALILALRLVRKRGKAGSVRAGEAVM